MDFSHAYVDYASSDDEDYVDLNPEVSGQGIQSVAHVAPEQAAEQLAQQRRSAPTKTKTKASARKLNKNVVSVDLGSLTDEAHHVATGDPYFCLNTNCRTILSSRDELLTEDPKGDVILEEGSRLWICRFCDNRNVIAIDDAEKPVGESQDYILERQSIAEAKQEEPLVVFCVDVSGSMGSRCKVPDGEKAPSSGLPTRLQAVQSTVADQLQSIARDNPNTRVALVAFSSNVTIHGDGTTGRQQVVSGTAALNSKQLCTQFGVDYVVNLSANASREQLTAAMWSLKKGGQTALGPALVTSIAMASQRRGSSVILCTDGCANVGMGTLRTHTDNEEDVVSEWYQQIGEWALEAGVVVNIVSITDDGCKLELLGNVCDLSEGIVTLVNPLELTRDFSELVQRAPIATHVSARMFVHPGLRFLSDEESLEQTSAVPAKTEEVSVATAIEVVPENEEKDLEGDVKHTVNQTQDVGNAFKEHQIYFEYAVKKEDLPKYEKLTGLPFQVQLHYTRLDGAKMLRVITHIKPMTKNREEVVRSMNAGLLSRHSGYKSQRLAKKGNYEAARANTYLTGTWLATNSRSAAHTSETNEFIRESAEFDAMMQTEQMSERMAGLRAVDMSENERRSTRSRKRNDKMAARMRKR